MGGTEEEGVWVREERWGRGPLTIDDSNDAPTLPPFRFACLADVLRLETPKVAYG
jgi:hypothetical protein